MKMGKFLRLDVLRWIWTVATVGQLLVTGAARANDETFDELQVGTQTYKNVTVTTKSKAYIFILHSAGMTNIRVSDLPEDVRSKLGYADLTEKTKTNSASAWAKQTISKLQNAQVKGLEEKLSNAWRDKLTPTTINLPPVTPKLIAIVTAAALLVFFFFSYCCMLICQKTGKNPGIWIFIPVLQWFPMMRAANMSPWWLLAFLVPVLNLIASILWSINISHARGKSGWVALWLILPPTSLFAFLYLAFSNGAPQPRKVQRPVQIMTLETA